MRTNEIQTTPFFTIQPTRRGDYLIRNACDREVGRATTESEARELCNKLQAEHDAAWAEYQEENRLFEEFNATTPELNQLQIQWQNWRSEFYDALCYENRRVAAGRRALDRIESRSKTYENHESNHARAATEMQVRGDDYEMAVHLDTEIKRARRARDVAALTDAIERATAFAREKSGYVGMSYIEFTA